MQIESPVQVKDNSSFSRDKGLNGIVGSGEILCLTFHKEVPRIELYSQCPSGNPRFPDGAVSNQRSVLYFVFTCISLMAER